MFWMQVKLGNLGPREALLFIKALRFICMSWYCKSFYETKTLYKTYLNKTTKAFFTDILTHRLF